MLKWIQIGMFATKEFLSVGVVGITSINILALDTDYTFALKNLQKILEGIDDIARHEENLIQN